MCFGHVSGRRAEPNLPKSAERARTTDHGSVRKRWPAPGIVIAMIMLFLSLLLLSALLLSLLLLLSGAHRLRG